MGRRIREQGVEDVLEVLSLGEGSVEPLAGGGQVITELLEDLLGRWQGIPPYILSQTMAVTASWSLAWAMVSLRRPWTT